MKGPGGEKTYEKDKIFSCDTKSAILLQLDPACKNLVV